MFCGVLWCGFVLCCVVLCCVALCCVLRNKLVENPPVEFIQKFYECTSDPISAFQNAVGIAQVTENAECYLLYRCCDMMT